MGYIYRIRHIESGMSYIGQTIHLEARLNRHFNTNDECRYLNNATNKYGIEAFDVDIICEAPNELLTALEICYIKVLNTLAPNGYNLTEGGEGGRHSAETCKRRSESLKGENHPMYGKSWSEEVRHRMSVAQSGKILSEQHRKAISEGLKGRILSEETRRKISEAHTGKRHSPEHVENIASKLRGRVQSEEEKQKNRNSWTPERRRIQSERLKKQWQEIKKEQN